MSITPYKSTPGYFLWLIQKWHDSHNIICTKYVYGHISSFFSFKTISNIIYWLNQLIKFYLWLYGFFTHTSQAHINYFFIRRSISLKRCTCTFWKFQRSSVLWFILFFSWIFSQELSDSLGNSLTNDTCAWTETKCMSWLSFREKITPITLPKHLN